MILKKDAEKLTKARGVSLRYNNGVASSIQLAFTYKGVQCRETVGYQVNQQGLNSASNMHLTIHPPSHHRKTRM